MKILIAARFGFVRRALERFFPAWAMAHHLATPTGRVGISHLKNLAFLVSEPEFTAFERLSAARVKHWRTCRSARPVESIAMAVAETSFSDDPDGDLLEMVTRTYGAEIEVSGG